MFARGLMCLGVTLSSPGKLYAQNKGDDLFQSPELKLRPIPQQLRDLAPSEKLDLNPPLDRGADELTPIRLPFYFNDALLGDIDVWMNQDGELDSVDSEALFTYLKFHLRPDVQEELSRRYGRRVPASELQEARVFLQLNYEELVLRLHISPEMKKTQVRELYSPAPVMVREQPLRTADVSGFINTRFGLDYLHSSEDGDEGILPLRNDFEGAVNIRNFVVESQLHYAEDTPYPWHRGETRLVHDDPDRLLRYTVGDLQFPVTGLQSFVPLLGFSVSRNFALQPYRVVEPLGQTSFFLRAPSKVEVLVNGRPLQTLQLPAGPHNLRSFPFVSGSNEVMLRITDNVGRLEVVRLSFFFDPRLLAAGEQEFSYSVGFPSDRSRGRLEYDFDTPSVSMFHRRGLNDLVTLGFNTQANDEFVMSGVEAVWATPFGVFLTDVGASYLNREGVEPAFQFQYRFARDDVDDLWSPIFTVGVQYRGRDFATLGSGLVPSFLEWDFNARLTQRLPWNMHTSLGGSYQVRRDRFEDTSNVGILVSKRWHRNFVTDISLDRYKRLEGDVDYRVFLSFTWLLPEVRQSFIGTHDTLTDTSRLDWNYHPEYLVGGIGANAGVLNSSGSDQYGMFGSARYVNYRSETTLSHDISVPRHGGSWDERSSLRFGSALVYADGNWGISRPIQDSFAIADAHPSLKEQEIGLDKTDHTYAARNTWAGPAILPDLTPYIIRNVQLDAPELPPGYDLGNEGQTLKPTYKSGTVIRVGEDPKVVLEGMLVDFEEVPLTLQAGTIVSMKTGDRFDIFTNRKGEFYVEGLRPGSYQIKIDAEPDRAIYFTIPEGTVGLHKIPKLRFTAPQLKR